MKNAFINNVCSSAFRRLRSAARRQPSYVVPPLGGSAFVLILACLAFITRAADRGWKLPPETTRLERGPGVEVATAQCLLCHSADYIAIQPPMNRAAWSAAVTKMKEKYGAPIVPDATNTLVNYLVKTYGTEKNTTDKR
jgi:hypothetical protein